MDEQFWKNLEAQEKKRFAAEGWQQVIDGNHSVGIPILSPAQARQIRIGDDQIAEAVPVIELPGIIFLNTKAYDAFQATVQKMRASAFEFLMDRPEERLRWEAMVR